MRYASAYFFPFDTHLYPFLGLGLEFRASSEVMLAAAAEESVDVGLLTRVHGWAGLARGLNVKCTEISVVINGSLTFGSCSSSCLVAHRILLLIALNKPIGEPSLLSLGL